MDSFDFSNDTFTPVQLPDIYASRLELLNTYHKAAAKRLFVVSAPAGYGKTVSTLMWLGESGRKTIWIRLDAYDNSLSVFYKQLCAGILSVQPNNEHMINIINNPSFVSSAVDYTISLIAEFIQDDSLYALVFDDMQLVTNEEIRKSLPLVLKHLPYSFVILILSRNVPPNEIKEMADNGKAAIIGAAQLAISEDEIRKYFNRFGRSLTTDEAKCVHTITGGWAIAVNALVKSDHIELGQGSGQVLDDYLKKQIWDKWDEDLRDFMLKTSVVDEMTPVLCVSLTGRENSLDILNMLYQTNSFVSLVGGNIYCYHHLFLNFLRMRAKESDMDINELYKKLAKYYIEKKEPLIARNYALKCEDADLLIKIIFKFNQGDCFNGSFDEFINLSKAFCFDEVRETICDQLPFLYTTHLWVHYLCGNAHKTEYYLDKLYQYLPLIEEQFPQFLELILLLTGLDYRMKFTEQIERFSHVPQSWELHENQQGISFTMQLPFLHRGARCYCELADETIMEKWSVSRRLLLKDNHELINNGISCGLLYERNRLKEALEIALSMRNTVDNHTINEVYNAVFIHLAAVYYTMGNEKQADEVITELEDHMEKRNAHYLRPNLLAYKAKVTLMDGNKAAAETWLNHYFVTETEHLELYKIFRHFTTARAYMVLAQSDKAMGHILKLKQLAVDFHRLLDIAEASVLQAILEWSLGKRKEAQRTLETVLADMQPYGIIRVIADEGAAILPVIRRIIAKVDKQNYQGCLNSRYINDVHFAVYEQSQKHKGIAVNLDTKRIKLSKQQKHMLTLLAQGYKNAQIAELTGLKLPTVKSHIYTTYEKLDVTNSMDAVIRARELRIIE